MVGVTRESVEVERGARFDRSKINSARAGDWAAMRRTWKDGRGANRQMRQSTGRSFSTPTLCRMTPTPTLPLSGGGGAPSVPRAPGPTDISRSLHRLDDLLGGVVEVVGRDHVEAGLAEDLLAELHV